MLYKISSKVRPQNIQGQIFTTGRQDQHLKKVRSHQFLTCGRVPREFPLTDRSTQNCGVVRFFSSTNPFACVVSGIASTLLSLTSMRKSNRETYGTCLKHNKESRIESLVKHLLEETVLLASDFYCLELTFLPSLSNAC